MPGSTCQCYWEGEAKGLLTGGVPHFTLLPPLSLHFRLSSPPSPPPPSPPPLLRACVLASSSQFFVTVAAALDSRRPLPSGLPDVAFFF